MVRKGSRNISKSEPVITKVHWETLFTEIKTSVVFDVVTIRNWIIPHFKPSLKLLAIGHNLAKYVAAASGKIGYRKMIFLDNLLRAPPKTRPQPAVTCSKLTTETLEQGVKYVQS